MNTDERMPLGNERNDKERESSDNLGNAGPQRTPRNEYGNYGSTYSTNNRDNYGNRDGYNRQNTYPSRDTYPPRDTFPARDTYPPRDNYGNRDGYNRPNNYGNQGNYPNRDNYGNRDGYNRQGGNQGTFSNRDTYPPRDNYGNRDGYNRQQGGVGGGYQQRDGGYNRQGGTGGGYQQRDGYNRQGGTGGGYQQRDGYNRQGGTGGGYQQRDGYNRQGGGGYQQRDGYNRQGGGGGGYQQRDGYNRQGGGGYQQRDGYNRQGGGGYQQRDSYNRQGGGGYQQRDGYNRQGGGGYQQRGGDNRGGRIARGRQGQQQPQKPRPVGHLVSLPRMLAIQQFACRKTAVDYIRNARVLVNGVLSQDPNTRVNYKHDKITVDAMDLQRNRTTTYILVHKPTKIPASREAQTFTVHSMIHDTEAWYFPLGRLLKSASGLTLLTNDPVHKDPASTAFDGIEKEYRFKVQRNPKKTELTAMTKALKELHKDNSDVAKVEIVQKNSRNCWVGFTVKKASMQELLAILKNTKLEALSLHRYRIGKLTSEMLTPGSWKQLNTQEIAQLYATEPSADASFFFK